MSEIDDLNERAAELEARAEELREEASRLWWVEERARREREGYEPSLLEVLLLREAKERLSHPSLFSKIDWIGSESLPPIVTR